MYTDTRLVAQRQRDMLTQAQELRQARYLLALRRASRRAQRARERLSRAQCDARRASVKLDGSLG